jgi:hypothetical protein
MILRMFNCSEDSGVGLLAAGNLGLGSVVTWISEIEPALHALLTLGQISVAIATVVYFWRKAKAIGATKKDDQ